jgi:hypothetical protein
MHSYDGTHRSSIPIPYEPKSSHRQQLLEPAIYYASPLGLVRRTLPKTPMTTESTFMTTIIVNNILIPPILHPQTAMAMTFREQRNLHSSVQRSWPRPPTSGMDI